MTGRKCPMCGQFMAKVTHPDDPSGWVDFECGGCEASQHIPVWQYDDLEKPEDWKTESIANLAERFADNHRGDADV